MTDQKPRPLPKLLSLRETYELLRVGHGKVERLVHTEQLDGFDVEGCLRISADGNEALHQLEMRFQASQQKETACHGKVA